MKPERIMGTDTARAVGRFEPNGPNGYQAATAPDAPLHATRAEAVEDERAWLDRRCPVCRGTGGGTYNDCPACDGNGIV